MILSLIIPKPNCVIGEAFDVYLEPLVEELKLLWEVGVPTWVVVIFNGQTQFNMCAMLMWTMHDLPTYSIIVGCVTKG
jgi:hypothetical protein